MGLLPPFQSPYTSYTTLYGDSRHQEILYNMMGIVDQGCVCTLVLLDLSAAFNTVDHSVILETLKTRFTVDGDALGWVADFLAKGVKVSHTKMSNPKSRHWTSACHRAGCSASELLINIPKTSLNFSTSITYAITFFRRHAMSQQRKTLFALFSVLWYLLRGMGTRHAILYRWGRMYNVYVLYMRLRSFTSRRSKFFLTTTITGRAVAAALMHSWDDLRFDDTIMPKSSLLVHSLAFRQWSFGHIIFSDPKNGRCA